jgi:hypothetical protein
MKAPFVSILAASLCVPAAFALADTHRTARPAAAPAKVTAPRSVGVHMSAHPEQPVHPQNNPGHEYIVHDPKTNKDEHHAVIVDHRPAHVIDRDPHLRVVARGYHPTHDWGRFHVAHGGWFTRWGITAWDTVGTVSCEAVNETTGQLYPVSEDRDTRGWDDDSVNSILDAALDDCYGEANGATCGPATPSCSFQPY